MLIGLVEKYHYIEGGKCLKNKGFDVKSISIVPIIGACIETPEEQEVQLRRYEYHPPKEHIKGGTRTLAIRYT
jgi:hypothetical protein